MKAVSEVEKLEYRSEQSGEAYLNLKKDNVKVCSIRMRAKFKYFYYKKSITGRYLEISREEIINLIDQAL